MRKGFAVIGSSLALMALASIPASAVTFDRFVNPSGTCDPALIAGKPTHLTIQEAVNAALVNETIGVCPGTYTEQVTVNTAGLTVRRVGAADVRVVGPVAGASPAFGLLVSADGVTILGFEVSGFTPAGSDPAIDGCGIAARAVSHATITQNEVHHNAVGICLVSTDQALVAKNSMHDALDVGGNTGFGLSAVEGTSNEISTNRVNNNHNRGIVQLSSGATAVNVHHNTGAGHAIVGIFVQGNSAGSVVHHNTMDGIGLAGTDSVTVEHNVVARSQASPGRGIEVQTSEHCVLRLNNLSRNKSDGILLFQSGTCRVDGNRAIGNQDAGIRLILVTPGNTLSRNSATGNHSVDCAWDGSDAPVFSRNTCRTQTPPQPAWD